MCNQAKREQNWWDRILWQARWQARWPNSCSHCEGNGGFYSSYDPSPSGVSLSPGSIMDWDPCPDCTEKGICPRCGNDLPLIAYKDDETGEWAVDPDETDANKPCLRCGWNPNAPDFCPPEMECWCGYEAEREFWKEHDRLLDLADWREDWRLGVDVDFGQEFD